MTKDVSKCPKVTLITGITSPDSSYLAEFLLEKGYIVHGLKRVDHIYQHPDVNNACYKLHSSNLFETGNLVRILQKTSPTKSTNWGPNALGLSQFRIPRVQRQRLSHNHTNVAGDQPDPKPRESLQSPDVRDGGMIKSRHGTDYLRR